MSDYICSAWREYPDARDAYTSRFWAKITHERGSGWWDALMFCEERTTTELTQTHLVPYFHGKGRIVKLRGMNEKQMRSTDCKVYNYTQDGWDEPMRFFTSEPPKAIKEYHIAVHEQRWRYDHGLCPSCGVGERKLFSDVCTLCEP